MDLLIEILFDLILEGSIELSSNKKVPKIIRYPLIAIIILFFAVVIVGIFVLGIFSIKENIAFGIVLILLSLFFFVASIIKFKKVYVNKINEK